MNPAPSAGSYRERRSVVPAVVVWTIAAGRTSGGRVLPDGCMGLLWLDGDLVVAGPDTHAYTSGPAGGGPIAGIRLSGGAGPTALGVPAYEVRDLRVPVAELWGASTADALRRRTESADDAGAELERIVGSRLESRPADALMSTVDAMARQGRRLPEIATEVGLGERQLRRRSHEAFGYGIRTLTRIHRFQAALSLVRAGVQPADAAARTGYADQPHLAREVRSLAGVPISALLNVS